MSEIIKICHQRGRLKKRISQKIAKEIMSSSYFPSNQCIPLERSSKEKALILGARAIGAQIGNPQNRQQVRRTNKEQKKTQSIRKINQPLAKNGWTSKCKIIEREER